MIRFPFFSGVKFELRVDEIVEIARLFFGDAFDLWWRVDIQNVW